MTGSFAFPNRAFPMGRFRLTRYRHPYVFLAACTLAVAALLAPCVVPAQSQVAAESATLKGRVRDSHGQPVADAVVSLRGKADAQTLTASTDAGGNYRFAGVPQGTYTLRAEMAGNGGASFGPFVLGPAEAKNIDLTLGSAKASESQDASENAQAYFDEPTFTVAGVTDTTNLGGHGSDTVVRTKDALAKATLSLSTASIGNAPPVAPNAAAEVSLRAAVEHGPANFEANHRLGKLLVDEGKSREALPYLEQASRLRPEDYANAYELAVAYAESGDYEKARAKVRALIARQDLTREHKAELHHLLGDVEENSRNPLEAVREYQRAVELDATEPNLFDWGAELLLHRAFQPAVEVFTKGNHSFPHSVRMLVGLGVAWYVRGSYDQAARRLREASDLNPDDPNPYLFLGKIVTVESAHSDEIVEKLGRFVRFQPDNALANYYYAVALWKQRKGPEDTETPVKVEALLEKAVRLDPKLADAYVQLGVLYADRKDFPKAISSYRSAIEASPKLEAAHYRLAQAYRLSGDNAKAQTELQLYGQLSKETAAEVQRERSEMKQFVYTLRDRSSVPPQTRQP